MGILKKLFQIKAVRWAVFVAGTLFTFGVLLFAFSEYTVYAASKDRMTSATDDLPEGKSVGLVLGCAPRLGARDNLYFVYRIQAAVKLWQSGKVYCLIVSGDNSLKNYNEPEAMKEALMKEGVPGDRIVCDYAGLRTLDSVVRAKEIFGAGRLVIVSQPFHNARALTIADHYDIDAYGYNARDVDLRNVRLKNWTRERLARVMMVLDLLFLDTPPKYLGRQEYLPGEE